ncbi:MAG: signal peptidase II [Candidatus Krumholzibacteria bacterium]|nr:signal peptidase II [Candidatus Krumholzibacteria bacterium]
MASGADRRLFWAVVAGVLTLDLITKFVAEAQLSYHPLPVIGEYVRLRLVYNEGAAFGLHVGEHSRWIFFLLALVALIVLASMVRATRAGDRFRLAALALICGGAGGNLIDRIRSAQGVVDFLDVGVGAWRWPTFNVADSAITVGAVALALSLWAEGRHQERAKEAGTAAT